MRVINSNETYKIYNNHVKIYNELPSKIYKVQFNEMEGFSLEETGDLTITDSKIYGVHLDKVNKVLTNYKKFERNLGVILSGDKGIGKSLFARLLSIESVKNNYPVIIVDRFIPGISNFIDSIDQEVVVLFDEFDKSFKEEKCQTSLLSLFDGLSSNKKLFIITCNSVYGLNGFLINRPGRFHYHFRFNYPTFEEIEEYLKDKLDEKYWGEINNVIKFSSKVDLNYDCLRSITYELSTGISFKEAISDLNILNLSEKLYNINLIYNNGKSTSRNYELDLFNYTMEECITFHDIKTNISFFIKNIKMKDDLKSYFINKEDIKVDENDSGEEIIPEKIIITKAASSSKHYLV